MISRMSHFVLALLLSASAPAGFEDATDESRFSTAGQERIVQLTQLLESRPLQMQRGAAREILDWWIDNPELRLNWCAGMLTAGQNGKITPSVISQGLFGAGSYLLRHPDQADDRLAIHLAGVKSALALYRAAVAADLGLKDHAYEQMLDLWDAGELDAWVAREIRNCEKSEA